MAWLCEYHNYVYPPWACSMYKVTPYLIGWAQTYNQLCCMPPRTHNSWYIPLQINFLGWFNIVQRRQMHFIVILSLNLAFTAVTLHENDNNSNHLQIDCLFNIFLWPNIKTIKTPHYRPFLVEASVSLWQSYDWSRRSQETPKSMSRYRQQNRLRISSDNM